MPYTPRNLFSIFLIIISFSSCARLQWRATDREIYDSFREKAIPTEISYFNIDSLDLSIRVQHIKEADTQINLVFFHGSPSSLSAWNGYLKDTLLQTKANLHAVDRPGYGYSNFGQELPEIHPQAELMSALLDHYDLKNVITIGSSYGGPLAARVAVLNPRVKGVIMISPAIDPDQEQQVWASRLTQWWTTRWLVPRGYRVAGDEKTIHATEMEKIDGDWHRLKIPVMHIHGDADDLVPYTNVNYTSEKFQNIEIITTPDTGHEIAWARPDLVMPYVLKMIEQVRARD